MHIIIQVVTVERTEMSRPPITTHVLDTALGRPAEGVPIELCRLGTDMNSWQVIGSGYVCLQHTNMF